MIPTISCELRPPSFILSTIPTKSNPRNITPIDAQCRLNNLRFKNTTDMTAVINIEPPRSICYILAANIVNDMKFKPIPIMSTRAGNANIDRGTLLGSNDVFFLKA